MCRHVEQRGTGSPKKSFNEFKRRLPSFGQFLSIELINGLSMGFIVMENNAFSNVSRCMGFHFKVMDENVYYNFLSENYFV